MKKLFKWKTAYLFVLLFVMFAIIMFTRHDMKEEISKEGQTVVADNYAYTYLNNEKCTFRTPTDWNRFFKDTQNTWIASYFRQGGMDFISYKEDGSVDFYVAEIDDYDVSGIESIASLSDEEKQALLEVLTYSDDAEAEEINDDLVYGFSSLGDNEFLKSGYTHYIAGDKEYLFSVNYIFINDGRCIIFVLNLYVKEELPFEEGIKRADDILADCLLPLTWDNSLKKYGKVSDNSFISNIKNITFPIWIFALPLVLLLISNMQVIDKSLKHSGKIHWQENVLGLENSKTVLGYFAILVMFHHISQAVGSANSSVFVLLENFGFCLVAGYFFFSGYGLIKSMNQKENYMKGFFVKRLPKILVPFYVCNFIYILAGVLCHRISFDLSKAHVADSSVLGYTDMIRAALGVDLLNGSMWYIVEIVFLYIAFYIAYKLFKKEMGIIVSMTVFIIGLTLFSLFRGHGSAWFQGEWWYNSTLIFAVGMVFAFKEDLILEIIKKYYYIYLVFNAGMFYAFCRLTHNMLIHHGYWTESNADKFMTLGSQLMQCLFFVLLIIGILHKVRFSNKALAFIGKISLELYLIHNVFIHNGKGIRGTGVYVLFIVVGTIILAGIVHAVDTFVICKIYKKPIPKLAIRKVDFKSKTERFALRVKLNLRYVKRHKMRTVIIILRTLFCIFLCVLSLVPLYFIFINSSLSMGELVKGIHFIPGTKFVDNYNEFNQMAKAMSGGIKWSLVRSCVISGSAALLATYFGAACAYGFELYEFKGKKMLWRVIVVAIMFSTVGSSIGYLKMLMKFRLLNTYIPLILPAIATPSAAYFMRMYLRTLNPKEIVEAARIDGCSEIGIFNRIAIPMLKPALSLLMIFNFVSSWNNSYLQSLVIYRPDKKTLALFMKGFASYSKGTDPIIYMLLVLSIIPPLIVYAIFAKSITSRIAIGAVKE